VRTVDLGGSLVYVATTYAIRALEDGANQYVVSLGEKEAQTVSWFEAKLKGQSEPLKVTTGPLDPQECGLNLHRRRNLHWHVFLHLSGTFSYTVDIPEPLSVNGTVNLVVETVLTHTTYPWPEKVGQENAQSLKYEGDLLVLSPYKTATQRVKVRCVSCSCAIRWRITEHETSAPEPRIISHTTPKGLDSFTTDNIATKMGGTITYGPFHNIPPSASAAFIEQHQKHVVVHYFFGAPVVEITSLKRCAEISHWGANLNIQNDIALHNAGAAYAWLIYVAGFCSNGYW
jgi:oligosaccharyltransferase complex subunit alpha (ribophorin I)